MAIQMRRGSFTRFDPTKMLPGEWAIVLSDDASAANGQSVYICFAAGTVKRMLTVDEVSTIIANFTQQIAGTLAEVREATEEASAAATEANDAIDAIEDISELAVPLMSTTVRGGARLGSNLVLTDGALCAEIATDADVNAAVDAAFAD